MQIRHLRFLLCQLLILAAAHTWAGEKSARSLEEVFRLAAPPENKVRTLGQEWVWELEQAGIYNRRLPRRYRVSLPIAYLGEKDSVVILTYTSPGTTIRAKRLMLMWHVPLD